MVHNQQIVPVAAPGAGQELIVLPRAGEDWRILGITYTLTTSAVVANRTSTLVVDDQTGQGFRLQPGSVQAATAATIYSWVCDLGYVSPAATFGLLSIGIPPVILPTGWRIRTLTNNLDVGDAYSNVTVFFERMDEPPYLDFPVGSAQDEALQHDLAQSLLGG